MVWNQYVYEASNGFDPEVSDDDEFNDEHTPLNIEDWEVEYSDELRHMWNTIRTLTYDAGLQHSGEFVDFVEFCYKEHDACEVFEEDEFVQYIWTKLRRIINDNGLHEEMMRGATIHHFTEFMEKYMRI
jgi:hypothetical protein